MLTKRERDPELPEKETEPAVDTVTAYESAASPDPELCGKSGNRRMLLVVPGGSFRAVEPSKVKGLVFGKTLLNKAVFAAP
jgi:hypothetical protein